MDETTALPACLTDPSILYVEANDWGDMLYMVQKRLDGKRSGWFVVTIAQEQSFWDGPYTQRKALARFDQQLDCLQAVLAHVGALQPAEAIEPPDLLPILHWSEQQWERNWQVVSRRLIGAPAIVAESSEVQAVKAKLDRTFIAGDARAFAEAACQLIELCEQIAARDAVMPWWKVTC